MPESDPSLQPGCGMLSFVDNTSVKGLWVKIYSFLGIKDILMGMKVCKTFSEELPRLVTELDIAPNEPFTQDDLDWVSKHLGQHLTSLSIKNEYDDNLPQLDFEEASFPLLEGLTLDCAPLVTLKLTTANTPCLKALCISHQGPEPLEAFELQLPELRSLSFEHVEVMDGSEFGESLTACPKLEQFSSYKLWGLGTYDEPHEMVLPNCEELSLYRSDDLTGLIIRAPKLRYLNLQACYSLEHVRLRGKRGAPLRINLINANIDRRSLRHLKGHPRVAAKGGGVRGGGAASGSDDMGDMDDPMEAMMWGMGMDEADLDSRLEEGPRGGGGEEGEAGGGERQQAGAGAEAAAGVVVGELSSDMSEEEEDGEEGPMGMGYGMFGGFGAGGGHHFHEADDDYNEDDDDDDDDDDDEYDDGVEDPHQMIKMLQLMQLMGGMPMGGMPMGGMPMSAAQLQALAGAAMAGGQRHPDGIADMLMALAAQQHGGGMPFGGPVRRGGGGAGGGGGTGQPSATIVELEDDEEEEEKKKSDAKK